ncbi:hypothetical protein KY385_03700 [Candidatus Parcubacteria bacterium]|nr:hypothetical protein [Candidatus Parcubacteria bacterium]
MHNLNEAGGEAVASPSFNGEVLAVPSEGQLHTLRNDIIELHIWGSRRPHDPMSEAGSEAHIGKIKNASGDETHFWTKLDGDDVSFCSIGFDKNKAILSEVKLCGTTPTNDHAFSVKGRGTVKDKSKIPTPTTEGFSLDPQTKLGLQTFRDHNRYVQKYLKAKSEMSEPPDQDPRPKNKIRHKIRLLGSIGIAVAANS